jgi:hypothetical protein
MSRPPIRPHSGPRFLGPAFIIALLGAAYLLWRQYAGGAVPTPWMPKMPNMPILERHVTPSKDSGHLPTPDFVLQHIKDLNLPAKTAEGLENLSRRSAQELQPLKAKVDEASRNFSNYMDRQRQGQTAMGDIRRRMDAVDEAANRADDILRQFWSQATAFMSPEQKARLEDKYLSERRKTLPHTEDKRK